ncbi:MAG TPA: FtsX-like permease family protein [Bryobacteraceae bacterium]|nr:FtsX-like permease family protein [Bryobacteraceae bacterium]
MLASIGLYGVTAYNAGLRSTEVGVRMALGADRGQVVALVLRGAFALIAFGLLIGLPLALMASLIPAIRASSISPIEALRVE